MNSGFRLGENMAGMASDAKFVREPTTKPRPRKARKTRARERGRKTRPRVTEVMVID